MWPDAKFEVTRNEDDDEDKDEDEDEDEDADEDALLYSYVLILLYSYTPILLYSYTLILLYLSNVTSRPRSPRKRTPNNTWNRMSQAAQGPPEKNA